MQNIVGDITDGDIYQEFGKTEFGKGCGAMIGFHRFHPSWLKIRGPEYGIHVDLTASPFAFCVESKRRAKKGDWGTDDNNPYSNSYVFVTEPNFSKILEIARNVVKWRGQITTRSNK